MAFGAPGWSTTVPAKDQENAFDIPSTKAVISEVHKPLSVAAFNAKNPSGNANMTEAPDPATPFLIGSGLIAISVLRRGLKSKTEGD